MGDTQRSALLSGLLTERLCSAEVDSLSAEGLYADKEQVEVGTEAW